MTKTYTITNDDGVVTEFTQCTVDKLADELDAEHAIAKGRGGDWLVEWMKEFEYYAWMCRRSLLNDMKREIARVKMLGTPPRFIEVPNPAPKKRKRGRPRKVAI